MKEIKVSDKLYKLIKQIPERELENLLEMNVANKIVEKPINISGVFSLYCDGASRGNPGLAGAGFVIFERTKEIASGKKFLDEATNNVAEWTALILALEKASKLGIKNIECFMDSKLVAEQASGNWKVKNSELQKLFLQFHNIRQKFNKLSFSYIPREKNALADKLANEAIDNELAV